MSTFKNPIGSISDADIYWKEREKDGSHRAGDIRIDEYKGIDNVSKVKGEGVAVRHNGYFSEDNPVLAQLAVAKTNADKDWLYELAVKWELDRANLEEQRAYDDPRARLARERQAGIDSTLSGGAGAVSAGGSSSVMPATQSNLKPSNFYDNANLAINGVSLGFQGLGTIIDGANKVLSFVQGVSTFGDFISQNSSATTLASESATHAQQQTASNKLLLDSQRMSNISQRYKQAGDIATLIPEGLTSDDDWNEHLDTFGIQDQSMRKLIRHIAESPEARAKYEDMIHNARQAEAINFAHTFDILRDIESNSISTALAQSDILFRHSMFESALASTKYSYENLQKTQDTVNNNVDTALTESKRMKAEAKEKWQAWRISMAVQKASIERIDEQIAEVQKQQKQKGNLGNIKVYEARLNTLAVQRIQIQTMMDKQAGQMANFLQQKYYSDFVDSQARVGDYVVPGWTLGQSPYLNWAETQFNFTGSISSDESLNKMENIAMKLIDIVL